MRILKRITAVTLVVSMALFSLCSCGNDDPSIPDGMILVDSDFVSCKLYVPDDWIPQSYAGADTGTSMIGAKASDGSNVSLVPMTPSGSYASADDYFRTNYYTKIQSTFKNTVLLEDECSTEGQYFGVQEVGCVKYVYTVESDGVTYKIMQYFMMNAGYLYIFTYTAAEAVFSEHLEEVSSMVKNFEF